MDFIESLLRSSSRYKMSEKGNFVCFISNFCQFSQKRSNNLLLCFVFSFLWVILINFQEMDLIELFKSSFSTSEWFGPYSHNYLYYSVVTKCCPILLHHVASLVRSQSCRNISKVWITLKVIFIVRKVQFGPLWSIWANISETVHAMINVSMKHSYKIIYNLAVYINTCNLRWHLKV